ncbi:hypothetical protein [Henriciella marina]|uniref:hypothetical protein n=1 Tax=Henriciella marina TaxID=453851 RepID=UPI00037E2749|nr:hypothetical protein [Henriciella marina]
MTDTPENIVITLGDNLYQPSTVLWLLAEELTITEASLLFLNLDPGKYHSVEYQNVDQQPAGYRAIRQVLIGALRKQKISGLIVPNMTYEENERPIENSVDPDRSTVDMDSLREWLRSKRVDINHLFELVEIQPDYLNPDHPHYAPKLAATIAAWEHVSANPDENRTVKDQVKDWLTENASKFELVDDEGKVTDQFLNDAARIANWNPGGGRLAAKGADSSAESSVNTTSVLAPRKLRLTPSTEAKGLQGPDFNTNFDEEIPF